jgi:hypothetical protein
MENNKESIVSQVLVVTNSISSTSNRLAGFLLKKFFFREIPLL